MSGRQALVAVVVVLAMVTVWTLSRRPNSSPVVSPSSTLPVEDGTGIPQEAVVPPTPPTGTEKIETPAEKAAEKTKANSTEGTIVSLIPSTEKLRAEVKENAHQTPPSLYRFSRELATRTEGLVGPSQARAFMAELGECIGARQRAPEQIPSSIESLCLLHAQKTEEKFPELHESFLRLRDTASAKARLILNTVK